MEEEKEMANYENTEKTGNGNVPLYPRFYFKHVGGRISIYHRYTHCYLESFETEEEVAEAMEEWSELSQRDLWEYLLVVRYAQLVKPLDFPNRFSHDEEWYISAWGIYTARFYEKYPHLFNEEMVMPYPIAFKVLQAHLESEHAKYKRAQDEREKATARIEQEEKAYKHQKIQEELKVEIGNVEQLEKAQNKARRIIPLKKKKGAMLKTAVVSENPFD